MSVSDYREKGIATAAMVIHWISGVTLVTPGRHLTFLHKGCLVMVLGFLLLPQPARFTLPPAFHRVLGESLSRFRSVPLSVCVCD